MLIKEQEEKLVDNISFDFDQAPGILVVNDFFPEKECNMYIDFFRASQENNEAFGRGNSYNVRDVSIVMPPNRPWRDKFIMEFGTPMYNMIVNRFFDKVYPEYISKYNTLSKAELAFSHLKIQKTEPGQGFHNWHSENAGWKSSSRCLFYILYLNDDFDGGETEFLYFSKRIKPKKGTMLVAPSDWLFAHRGNPPLDGTKYISTGWLHYLNG